MVPQWFRKTYITFFVYFIIIALQTPIYHQHVADTHRSESVKHTDHIEPHHSNDYSVDVHGKDTFQEALPEDTDHSHNHAHFEKELFRKTRIENIAVNTAFVYGIVVFDNVSKHLLSFSKSSYNPNARISYRKIFAKTSSGLSPPVYSS